MDALGVVGRMDYSFCMWEGWDICGEISRAFNFYVCTIVKGQKLIYGSLCLSCWGSMDGVWWFIVLVSLNLWL